MVERPKYLENDIITIENHMWNLQRVMFFWL